MPIVPRVNPQVRPIGELPRARNTTDVPMNPLGGLADATRGFGALANEFAQKEKKRNDLTAVMAARRRLSEFEGQLFDPENPEGINAYRGKNALGANEGILPQLDAIRGEIEGTLHNDEQRALFANIEMNFRDSLTGRLNGHMQREHEAFLAAEQKAATANLTNDAVTAALSGDFGLAASRGQELLAMNRALMETQGMPEDFIKAAEREQVSGIHASIVDGMLARDPLQAQSYYDRFADQFSAVDRARVERALQPFVQDAQAEADKDDALAGVAPPARDFTDAAQVQSTFRTIAEQHGATITSMVRPVISRGAGARSQHPKGTAADFRTKDKTPEQVEKLMADLRAAGFEVIDERNTDQPHIHAELPPAVGGADHEPLQAIAATEPQTLGEALSRLDSIADPTRRKRAETKVRQEWSIREQDKADQERTSLEAMRLAVEGADPRAKLRDVLGPQYEMAVANGWDTSLQARLDKRATGELVQSDPILVDALTREAVLSPETFKKRDIYANANRLDTADLARLTNLQADLRDPKKRGAAEAKWATEAQRLESAYRQLGFASVPGKPQRHAAERGQFEIFYQQAKAAFIQSQGKEPDQAQADALMRDVVRRVALNPSLLSKAATAEKFAGSLSESDRATVLQVLRARGITNPTDAQITAAAGAYYSTEQ